jgi:ABC-type antimicrobial peptide transport system permease subunit
MTDMLYNVLVGGGAFLSALALFYLLVPIAKVPIRYNLRSAMVRWLTALVTAVAVTLVIANVVGMTAFVKGMDQMTATTGHPGNVLLLSDGATDETFSRLSGGFNFSQFSSPIQNLILKTDDKKFLASKEVYVIVTHVVPGSNPVKRRFVQMRGVDDPRTAAQLHGIELAAGEWFASTGEPQVVIGDGVAKTFGKDLGRDTISVGDELEIGPIKNWKVAGIMKPSGSTFGSEIWVHDGIVQDRFGRVNAYSSFVIRTANAADAQAAAKLITDEKSADRAFQAYTERQYYSNLSATNDQFRIAIVFVAIMMALGGVLGVMITMFAAVSQRVKDIGVLRLLGYTRGQILLSFLVESVLIALVGGLIGCAIGLLFNGATMNSIVSSGQGGGKTIALKLVVDGWLLLGALSAAVLMGGLGGFIPAFNAMRLKPLESLK